MQRQPLDPELLSPDHYPALRFPDHAWDELMGACEALEIPVNHAKRPIVEAIYSHLLGVNDWLNLTRLTTPTDYLTYHILDSLTALDTIRDLTSPGDICIDLGSGGGYPGLPLMVWLSDRTWYLVDSRGRKAAFLAEAIKLTHCTSSGALAFRGRNCKQDAPRLRGKCQFVVARAVGRAAKLLTETTSLLHLNGFLLLMKGPAFDATERRELLAACPGTGFEFVQESRLTLQLGGHARCLVLLAKTENQT